jgi:molybdopterin/thiamine biosynthesis adenylyltransferase
MVTHAEKQRLEAALRSAAGEEELTLPQSREIAGEFGLSLLEVERSALEAGIVPAHYSRNMGTLGHAGQRQLLESRVAVVGLGGLGGHVVEALARLGVGHIVGVDGDSFVESNLNRQILSSLATLGEQKAALTAEHVRQVNPAVQFEAHASRFEELEPGALEGSSLVFDCLDTIPARMTLERVCAEMEVILVHGAIAGWAGQVAVVRPGSGLLSRLYGTSRHGMEERLGNLHFTAAVAANMMVARAVPLLLGESLPERNTVRFFDLEADEWESAEL